MFSGMIWYGSFFGDHSQVNKFFGIPDHHAEAGHEDGHGKDHGKSSADHDTAHGDKAHENDAQADDGHHGKAHVSDGVHAAAPEGAIFMGPDNNVMDEAHYAPTWVKVSPFVAMLIGFITAFWFYIWDPKMPGRLAENNRPLYLFLLNKWYFDEIYDAIFVNPAKALGRLLWRRGDGSVIDGTINGIAMAIVPFFTRLAGRAQSGYIFTYAFAMVIGIVVLVTWMSFTGGGR